MKGNPKIDNDKGDLGLPDPNGQTMVLFVVEAPKGGLGARTRGLGQEMGSSPPDRASPTPNCSWKRELDSEFILVVTIDFGAPVEDQ